MSQAALPPLQPSNLCDHAKSIERGIAACGLGLFGGRPSVGICMRRCSSRMASGTAAEPEQPKPGPTVKDATKADVGQSPAILEGRMAACLACDGLRRMIRNADDQTYIGCRHCGCGSVNLGSSAASCPLSKWNKEIADG